jgi:hypothetical protein
MALNNFVLVNEKNYLAMGRKYMKISDYIFSIKPTEDLSDGEVVPEDVTGRSIRTEHRRKISQTR